MTSTTSRVFITIIVCGAALLILFSMFMPSSISSSSSSKAGAASSSLLPSSSSLSAVFEPIPLPEGGFMSMFAPSALRRTNADKLTREALFQRLDQVVDCARNFSSHHPRSSVFDLDTGLCHPLPNFAVPLHKFEVSPLELSCNYDGAVRPPQPQRNYSTHPTNHQLEQHQQPESMLPSSSETVMEYDTWQLDVRSYFDRVIRADPELSLMPLSSIGGGGPNAPPVPIFNLSQTAVHKAFMYHSSWYMKQFLPWEQLLQDSNKKKGKQQKSKQLNFTLRGYHDENYDNIYRLENVCISPYGGISGFQPKLAPFTGRDETRDKFFPLHNTKRLLQWVKELPESPPASRFDERPVVILEVGPLGARDNLAHMFHRYLSLVGTLRMNPFEDEGFVPLDKQEQEQQQQQQRNGNHRHRRNPFNFKVKPLILLLWSEERFLRTQGASVSTTSANSPRFLVNAIANFIRTLDLPVATIILPANGRVAHLHIMSKIFAQQDRGDFRAEIGSVYVPESGSSVNKSELCFRRGLAWFSCKSCAEELLPHEAEEFSFGMFAPPTLSRVAIVKDYLRMIDRCLVFSSAVAAAASSALKSQQQQQQRLPLPRVFFDIRQHDRFIFDVPFLLDLIRRRITGFVSEVVFAEPGKGSRSATIAKVKSSNIFFGIHGAAFADVALLPPRSVVVEIGFPHHTFRCSFSISCWWSTFVKTVTDAEHHLLTANRTYDYIDYETTYRTASWFVPLAPQAAVDAINEAACRWLKKQVEFERQLQQEQQQAQSRNQKRDELLSLEEMMRRRFPVGLYDKCRSGFRASNTGRTSISSDTNWLSSRRPEETRTVAGNEQHLADLFFILTGASLQPSQLSLLAEQLTKLWPWRMGKLEGNPPRFWTLLLQHWWQHEKPYWRKAPKVPSLGVWWRPGISPSLPRAVCLDLFDGGGPPSVSVGKAMQSLAVQISGNGSVSVLAPPSSSSSINNNNVVNTESDQNAGAETTRTTTAPPTTTTTTEVPEPEDPKRWCLYAGIQAPPPGTVLGPLTSPPLAGGTAPLAPGMMPPSVRQQLQQQQKQAQQQQAPLPQQVNVPPGMVDLSRGANDVTSQPPPPKTTRERQVLVRQGNVYVAVPESKKKPLQQQEAEQQQQKQKKKEQQQKKDED